MKSDALFSPCRRYRWRLTRSIKKSSKEIIFIGLNPSSANASNNDSTLTRVINFCRHWDYGSLTVINLFGIVATNPRHLLLYNDPIGWRNNSELNKHINYWSHNPMCDLWIGWGVNGNIMNRNREILEKIKKYYFKTPYIIGLTKGGHPKHPLYISKDKYLYPFPY